MIHNEEENEEEEVAEPIDGDEQIISEKSPLEMAEDYIAWGELDKAQEILNTVKEKSGKKYYLQSRIYKARCWYSEQRKQLKQAVKAESDNEEYKKELAELEEFSKTPEYKSTVRKRQLGEAGGICAEGGAECCCLCICEGICEGIGNGC